jgi:hypothetical protein
MTVAVKGEPISDPQHTPSQTPPPTAATPVAAPAHTLQEQLSIIRAKLAERTMSTDDNSHAVNNPIWNEEEKP